MYLFSNSSKNRFIKKQPKCKFNGLFNDNEKIDEISYLPTNPQVHNFTRTYCNYKLEYSYLIQSFGFCSPGKRIRPRVTPNYAVIY